LGGRGVRQNHENIAVSGDPWIEQQLIAETWRSIAFQSQSNSPQRIDGRDQIPHEQTAKWVDEQVGDENACEEVRRDDVGVRRIQ
jgi:hypothetical protein